MYGRFKCLKLIFVYKGNGEYTVHILEHFRVKSDLLRETKVMILINDRNVDRISGLKQQDKQNKRLTLSS